MKLSEYQPRTTPFKHQWDALRATLRLDGKVALYCEPGVGKSKIAVDFAAMKHQAGKMGMILVVCPLSVMGVWEREVLIHTPSTIKYRVVKLAGSSKQKAAQLHKLSIQQHSTREGEMLWVITNYESIWRGGVGSELVNFGFDLFIADEGHRLKGSTTRQSVQAYRIGAKTSNRLLLTGTPITNSPMDLYGEMRFISPEMFSYEDRDGHQKRMTFKQFRSKYAITGGFDDPKIYGYQNLDELYDKVRSVSFIRKKEDCLDLPEKTFEVIPFDLDAKTRKAYIQMAEEMVMYLEHADTSTRVLANAAITKIMYLYRIVCGHINSPDHGEIIIGNEKLRTTKDLVEDLLAAGEKVVIFARFRMDLDRLEKTFEKFGCISIRGGVTEKERTTGIARFQSDPSVRVALCQIQSGSLGITLTASRTVVFYSTDYSYGTYYQATDRIHRIGQTRACNYYLVTGRDTIEEDIYRLILDKMDLADALMRRPQQLTTALRASIKALKAK